jgi:hypothetical protein
MAKIGVDLHIFETLKESKNALTLSQLVEESGAALGLLGRNTFTKRFLVLIICRTHPANASSFRHDQGDWEE